MNIEKAEDALFEIWDATASGGSAPAIFLVNAQAEGLGSGEGGVCADCYHGHSKYRLPPGWQPKDVAAALSNLVMDVADHEDWSREKLIGLLMEECTAVARDLAPLGSKSEADATAGLTEFLNLFNKGRSE